MRDATSDPLSVGEEVILQTFEQGIEVRIGIHAVADAIDPPSEIVAALVAASGCGLGEVIELYPRSATFDVQVK